MNSQRMVLEFELRSNVPSKCQKSTTILTFSRVETLGVGNMWFR